MVKRRTGNPLSMPRCNHSPCALSGAMGVNRFAAVSRTVPAISQNRHTTATESSLEAFNIRPWILTLCILRFFQSQWFLKKFAPREKRSRAREMRRLVWESFFAKWKTICGLPKPRSVANWDSACVPAVGRQSWLPPIWTASLIVPSADKFRTSKQRERRDG